MKGKSGPGAMLSDPLSGDVPESELSAEEFDLVRGLAYRHFGITLSLEKRSLVSGRLNKLLRQKGGISFREYVRRVEADPTGSELGAFIDRMSTNHTFFNREKDHFDFFRDTALAEAERRAAADGSRDVRVWCAAASTGEEPYMLAMIMREKLGATRTGWELGLLATDISERALTAARAGVYPADRVADIQPDLLRRHFKARPDGQYEASDPLKRDITYRRFNLMNEKYPFRKPFDVIFCRNVMIYFDEAGKRRVIDNLAANLRPGGYLLIGHAESLGKRDPAWEYVRPAVYRKAAA